MGLDSVELVVEVEKFFNISITGREAEKIHTLQDMTDVVAGHLHIEEKGDALSNAVLERVNAALITSGLANTPMHPGDKISNFLEPDNEELWRAFTLALNLEVPLAEKGSSHQQLALFRIFTLSPLYDWLSITVAQFIAVICACNLGLLTNSQRIQKVDFSGLRTSSS